MRRILRAQAGFTLLEILVAASITGVVVAVTTKFITAQAIATSAETNRLNARIQANNAKNLLRDRFLTAGSVMNISSFGGNLLLTFGTDPSSDTYSSAQNICIAKPPGAIIQSPPNLPAECVWSCAANQVPQIRISFKLPNGTAVTRLFPTNHSGLFGSVLCATQFAELETFPMSDRASDYRLLVYTGFATRRSGTNREALWAVDGVFLPGGVDRSVFILDQKTTP
jgi:prepilin-type N-terminal cleavage/methylation domain-containing protein